MRHEDGGRRCGTRMYAVLAVVGAVVMAAVVAVGCGSSTSNIFPFAGVWVANGGGASVLHFAGNEISDAGGVFNIPPKTLLNSSVLVSPQDTLFDNSGGLWVVDGGLNDGHGTGAAVYLFNAAQLASLNSQSAPSPVFIIAALPGTPAFFNFPQFAAFDAAGNLWVSDAGNSVIFEFTRAQLMSASGVATAPAATLVGTPAGVFNGTLGIAFDASGNLWVANNGGTTIVEIAAAAVASATGVTPVTPITVLNGSVVGGLATINNPWGILFDKNGNLWFTNEQLGVSACAGSIVEFTAASIGGGGIITPAPDVVIAPTAIGGTASLCDPNGISMNSAGNITIANAANDSLAEYTAAQITTGGAIVPNLFVVGGATGLSGPAGLSYGPLSLQ